MEDDGLKPILLNKHSVGGRSAGIVDDQEFQEAEVWEAVHGDHHHFEPRSSNFKTRISKSTNYFSIYPALAAHHPPHHGSQTQSSCSMITPGWSHNSADQTQKTTSISGFSYYNGENKQQYVEADHDEDEMIPPHEWIARRLAKSHISSSSVCEGAGRTLKGRDLSRVRNAVLAKTGFLVA